MVVRGGRVAQVSPPPPKGLRVFSWEPSPSLGSKGKSRDDSARPLARLVACRRLFWTGTNHLSLTTTTIIM